MLFGESLAGDLAGRGVNDDGQDAFVYYFIALLQCRRDDNAKRDVMTIGIGQ